MAVSHCSDDEDDEDVLGEDFQKNLDALKEACRLYGDESSEELLDDDDDLEDDDVLLLSIQRRFGATSRSVIKSVESQITYEEEDDEEILRSVERRFAALNRLESKSLISSAAKGSSNEPEDAKENGNCSRVRYQPGKDDFGISKIISTKGAPGSEISNVVSPCSEISLSPSICEDDDTEVRKVGFALPGQLEVFDDTFTSLSDEPVEGMVYDNISAELPGSTRTTLDALKKNRLCQKVLRSKLAQLHSKLEENKELKKRVRTLLDFERICKRRYSGFLTHVTNPSVKLISTSKRKGHDTRPIEADRRGPPDNEDVAKLREVQKKLHLTFEPRIWTKEEKRQLDKGVKQQIQESFVRSALESVSADDNSESLDEQIKAVAEMQLTPAVVRAALPGIDWNEVARVYVVGRTAMECKIQWVNHEDSLINNGPWTKMEDKRLWSIARQYKLCNWDLIALALDTNRTPSQCLIRYQRSLNAGIMRGSWTQEEDEQLRAAVELYGNQDWPTVAASMEGRTGSQCWNRWYKILHPIRQKSGRWDVEEDKRLKWAVSVYGPRMWKIIATHVPGRTEVQCRERWCNVLDPSLKLEEWTENEDKKLQEAVAKHGKHRWSAVANDLKPRTDNQCWRRWKHLHPEHLTDFQKDVHIQKVALMSNFVGRSKERSRLGPSDFTSEPSAFSENGGAPKICKVDKCRKQGANANSNSPAKKRKREGSDNVSTEVIPPLRPDSVSLCKTTEGGLPEGNHFIPRGVTPEYAKLRRDERIRKIRLARSSGKMQCWNRSTGKLNTGLGAMEHSEPCKSKQGQRLTRESKPVQHSLQKKDGTAAFTNLVREIAYFCDGACNVDKSVSVTKENTCRVGHNSFPSANWACEANAEHQGKIVKGLNSDLVNENITAQHAAQMNAGDQEVEAAVKAVLSWPFFFGLQEVWRKEWEQN